jgi:hypothetical protein
MEKTYYSPDGNPEVWIEGTQPEGYLTEEEWQELHPPVPYVPTRDEQIAALTAEYTSEKANLCEAYTTATMQGDTETAQSVAQDMADLDAWYDEEYAKIPDEEGSEDNGEA